MRHVLIAVQCVALALVFSASALAKDQVLVNGVVKSLSATSLTVSASGKDTTFAVDAKTNVIGKGIGTKGEAKKGKPMITDLLKEGDRVTVTYQESGSTRHASKISVAEK
jgi:hypothetical protein